MVPRWLVVNSLCSAGTPRFEFCICDDPQQKLSNVRSLGSANHADIEMVAIPVHLFAVARVFALYAITYNAVASVLIWMHRGNLCYLCTHLAMDLFFIVAFITITILTNDHFPQWEFSTLNRVVPIIAV